MPQINVLNPATVTDASLVPPSKAALRRVFLAQRFSLSKVARLQAADSLRTQLLLACLARTPLGGVVALYAAHGGELDVLGLASDLQAAGRSVALPVVQGKGLPLRFARWALGEPLLADAYGIAIPVQRHWLEPDCVVLPCVGFTVWRGQTYRLGYGGGFYDRTLAALRLQKPAINTIGVALASSRCVFEPAVHDEPLGGLLVA